MLLLLLLLLLVLLVMMSGFLLQYCFLSRSSLQIGVTLFILLPLYLKLHVMLRTLRCLMRLDRCIRRGLQVRRRMPLRARLVRLVCRHLLLRS